MIQLVIWFGYVGENLEPVGLMKLVDLPPVESFRGCIHVLKTDGKPIGFAIESSHAMEGYPHPIHILRVGHRAERVAEEAEALRAAGWQIYEVRERGHTSFGRRTYSKFPRLGELPRGTENHADTTEA